MKISSAIQNLQRSLIRKIFEESLNYKDVINLTIGDPDIATPRELVMEAVKLVERGHFGYPPSGGGMEIRKLVAETYNKHFGTAYTGDNVIMNTGSSEALACAVRTILDPGDEVIIFAPYYPAHVPLVEMSFAKPVIVDISKTGFKITPELLAAAMTEKTKAVIFCNPCNPTGVVMSREEISAICDYLADKDVFILADEIYNRIVYTDYVSFGAFPQVADKLIITNGFSKSHSMTGWRMGYTIGPKELYPYFLNNSGFTVGSPAAISLEAAKIALTKFDDLAWLAAEYKKRVDYMTAALTELGYKVVPCEGAFYLFVNYENLSGKDSLDFAIDLLKQVQVAVVPGKAFGSEGYFRLSLTVGVERLKEAVARIKNYK
ncbi:MAG: aminotransferase class I/II-fold pyridoxal phosphate-dependent enzyme [Fusobacteriaceae bacterium]|jgi:aminotransferase|nr:aminotransferase class I/II-fold pyridoxal phosphate-dependent enzyme [Fusobacteriaceae bacterium]